MTDTRTEPRKRVDAILEVAVGRDLSSWERNEFLPSVADRFVLTPKQEVVLSKIERRVYESEDDCE